jgi:fimbrial chaperone protein
MTLRSAFHWLRAAAAGAALVIAAPWPAQAQQIAPVLVELSAARRVVSVTVVNRSDQPMTLQSQVLSWDQGDGADRYAESSDLLVVPPVATIMGGATQIFRVALRRPPPTQELAYRLILQDVTAETQAPTAQNGSATVRLQFRHSLPVFVAPQGKASADARLVPCAAEPANARCIRLQNDGAQHVKVVRLVVEGAGWRKELPPATVLAASSRQWVLDAAVPGALTVTAETTAGALGLQLPQLTH